MLSVSHLALAFDSPSSSQFSQMNENTMPSRIASCLSFQPLPELESGLHQSIYDDGSYWLYASEQPISDLSPPMNHSYSHLSSETDDMNALLWSEQSWSPSPSSCISPASSSSSNSPSPPPSSIDSPEDPFTAYLLNNSYETERFPDQWSTAIFSSLEQDASYTFKPSYSPSPYTSPSSLASSPSRESSPTRSDRLHDQKRRFPCNIAGCGRRFTSQYTLKVHLEAHKPKAKVFFPCTEGCSERFSRQHDRLRHEVAKHGKVCEFLCDDCGRFFSTKKTLGNHKCPVAQGGTRWVIN